MKKEKHTLKEGDLITEDLIRQRSYQIYLEAGETDEKENWFQAEEELKCELWKAFKSYKKLY